MILYSYILCSEPFEKQQLTELLKRVPEAVQQKVLRFHRWQDQQTHLVGKLLTQRLLMQHGYGADCLRQLSVNAYGKPFIDGNVDFNISHSGSLVVIALSDAGRVGVDVEKHEAFHPEQPPYEGIDSFLRPEELESLQQAATAEAFYEFWTKKESVIKAKGMGLSLDLKDIYIHQQQAVYQHKGIRETWQYYALPVPPGYTATLCTQEEGASPQWVDFSDLLTT